MKSLLIGASAGLGRALAELLAESGHDLFLVASSEDDLAPLASDLSLRFGVSVHYEAQNLARANPAELRTAVIEACGPPDNLIYIAGVSTLEDSGPTTDELARRLMDVNFTAGVRIVNCFLDDLSSNPAGNIVGVGSVAACRGRRSNSVYGAAKRGLEFYFEALRHYLSPMPCRVQFYRLGYLRTRMTLGQALPFPPMDPRDAARRIRDNLGKDIGAVYLPWWWGGIALVLKMLPWAVFRKLDI